MQKFNFDYIYGPKIINLSFESNKTFSNEKIHNIINNSAEELAIKTFPYDDLCWQLAELELISEKGWKKYTNKELFKREEEIFSDSLNYIDLCWLICELRFLLKQKGFFI